jgi:hypothetical protein
MATRGRQLVLLLFMRAFLGMRITMALPLSLVHALMQSLRLLEGVTVTGNRGKNKSSGAEDDRSDFHGGFGSATLSGPAPRANSISGLPKTPVAHATAFAPGLTPHAFGLMNNTSARSIQPLRRSMRNQPSLFLR